MEMKILQKKVLFLHHLEHLPETSLAKEVYEAEKRMSLPGIMNDCSKFLAKFGLQDLKSYSYPQFKRLVKEKIKIINKSKVIEIIREKGYSKINVQEILNDNFERKPYITNLHSGDAKMRFKISSQMVPEVKMNFQSESKFKSELWECKGCGKRDTQSHLMSCKDYEDLRQGKDLSNDKDLVGYFKSIFVRRSLSD